MPIIQRQVIFCGPRNSCGDQLHLSLKGAGKHFLIKRFPSWVLLFCEKRDKWDIRKLSCRDSDYDNWFEHSSFIVSALPIYCEKFVTKSKQPMCEEFKRNFIDRDLQVLAHRRTSERLDPGVWLAHRKRTAGNSNNPTGTRMAAWVAAASDCYQGLTEPPVEIIERSASLSADCHVRRDSQTHPRPLNHSSIHGALVLKKVSLFALHQTGEYCVIYSNLGFTFADKMAKVERNKEIFTLS